VIRDRDDLLDMRARPDNDQGHVARNRQAPAEPRSSGQSRATTIRSSSGVPRRADSLVRARTTGRPAQRPAGCVVWSMQECSPRGIRQVRKAGSSHDP
jgi:hypothetical protein